MSLEYTRVGLTKQHIKALYEANQMLKKLFTVYRTSKSGGGIITARPDDYIPKQAQHVSRTPALETIREMIAGDNDVLFTSDTIFKFITEEKRSKIDDVIVVDGKVCFLTLEGKIGEIGTIVEQDESDSARIDYLIARATTDESEKLSDELMQSLFADNVEQVTAGPYRMKISKELFPVMKVADEAYFRFYPMEDQEGLFEAVLSSSRDGVSTWHIYDCIYY